LTSLQKSQAAMTSLTPPSPEPLAALLSRHGLSIDPEQPLRPTAPTATDVPAVSLLSDDRGVAIGGFVIFTNKQPISNTTTIDAISDDLDGMPMPEMIFGANHGTFMHLASGTTVRCSTVGGLENCARHEGREGIEVAASKHWKNKSVHAPGTSQASNRFDWTFSNTYCGELVTASGEGEGSGVGAEVVRVGGDDGGSADIAAIDSDTGSARDGADASADTSAVAVVGAGADAGADTGASGTTSTESADAGAASEDLEGKYDDAAPAERARPSPPVLLSECTPIQVGVASVDEDRKVDYDLLRQREPIVWHDTVNLFDTEHDDNGLSSLSLRVRVMQSCFFCLMRFYLRVDGVIVRIRETRIFHRFGSGHVAVEWTEKESDWDSVVARVAMGAAAGRPGGPGAAGGARGGAVPGVAAGMRPHPALAAARAAAAGGVVGDVGGIEGRDPQTEQRAMMGKMSADDLSQQLAVVSQQWACVELGGGGGV
jgi:type 2A phosphatase activator TIP41